MTHIEEQNVAAVIGYTRKLHDALGAKPLTKDMLGDIGVEDARKLRDEIYARHGKVFKNRWLQRYFESQDWYERNPAYSDALLTPVERNNAAIILAYEKQALRLADRVEA